MQVHFIDQPEQLAHHCAQLKDSGWIALDTEFVRQRTYYSQLCLLQVGTADTILLVDTLALTDLSPLLARVFDGPALKLLHAAYQDLEIFVHDFGRTPAPLYDTQVAAQLAGMGEQIGYAELVRQCLELEIDKSQVRTDWSQRPLSDEQLAYAADDVRHLGRCYELLHQRLAQTGREAWLEEDFRQLANTDLYREDPARAWLRIKLRRPLYGERLAALKALAAWREERAARDNLPRKWVVDNDALIRLASVSDPHPDVLAQAGVPPAKIRRYGQEMVSVAHQAIASAQGDEAPPPKASADEQELLKGLKSIIESVATEYGLTPGSLATSRDLLALIRREPPLQLQQGWRRRALGDRLDQYLQAQSAN